MGTALAISALPVIARILMDLKLMRTELGAMIMTAAMFNDLVGWLLFGVILSSAAPDGQPASGVPWLGSGLVVGAFVLALTVGRWSVQRALRWLMIFTSRSSTRAFTSTASALPSRSRNSAAF